MTLRQWGLMVGGLTVALIFSAPMLAFAETYLDWATVAELPGQGTSPHGGYTTTTSKCAVCHAVHGASAMGEMLLPTSAADACAYCHVNTASSYTQVYGSDIANYSGTDLPNAHNSTPTRPLKCVTCHNVHGAPSKMPDNAYLQQRLLNGAKTFVSDPAPNYDLLAGAPLSTDTSDTALSKWCAGCHFTSAGLNTGGYSYWGGAYYDDPYFNWQSHIMTTATATYGNPASTVDGQVAWGNSTQCASCHSSGYRTAAWPHYTAGTKFLESAANASEAATGAANARQDGVCLRCHVSGDAASGVGVTF